MADEFRKKRWRLYPGAYRRLRRFPSEYEAKFKSYDVLLSPVASTVAPKIGVLSPAKSMEENLEKVMELLSFTPVQNGSQGPTISVPTGMTKGGMSLVVQLAAPRGQERRLLELAFAVEDRRIEYGEKP